MSDNMTNEKAKMCLEDMKIKVPIPKAAKQARENNEALDVAIKALEAEPHCIPVTERLPSVQPEIIRCRNCKFASGDSRICMQFGHSPIGELDFCAWAERRTDE